MRRQLALGLVLAVVGSLIAPHARAQTEQTPAAIPAREVEPVVLDGAQLPGWSGPQAEGIGNPASGHNTVPGLKEVRDAHNGRVVAPPGGPVGVPVDEIVAYSYDAATGFTEIPVQIDERFPHFLANSRSDFAHYSGTDKELTYAWDVESWKKMFGECTARYANDVAEVQAAIDAGWVLPAATTVPADFLSAKTDPVPTLDNDDEVVFMASDAGDQAPLNVGPPGTGDQRQEIALADPRDPSSVRFVYLFTKEGGPSFDESNGYVDYARDENADEWIDRNTFANGDTEQLGSSNTGYGPNIPGTVCNNSTGPTAPRNSGDRFVRDGVTVSTETYQWRASGRWMVRGMRIAPPGQEGQGVYGPDLIDRWKGRAFQQAPDSSISVVGFEDEQVNWEANAALLGEIQGPVRAIRETWGADSGTNVTKTETFYRNAVHYRYHVRVHPIPPDGLYTSWDYNHDVADTYYNETRTAGVPIDGINDEIVGNVDQGPTGPAYFDAPDPTHTKPLAFFNWEQVSGKGDAGSLVYMFEMGHPSSLSNPLVVPYYRDDRCLDDGTGDNPIARPFPGESSTDPRVYPEETRTCTVDSPETVWKNRQGCFACHGVHYFVTHDTDNATTSAGPVDEIEGAQWQWAVPTSEPTNVGDAYANTVKTPLVPVAALQPSAPQAAPTPTPTDTSSASPAPSETPTPGPSGSPDQAPAASTNAGCDPLDRSACLLPFPNNFFTRVTLPVEDTDTGLVVNLDPAAMPRTGTELTDGGEGKPVDPIELNRNDGFSPGSMVMTMVPGLDLHKTWGTSDRAHSEVGPNHEGYFDHRDHIADVNLYLRDEAPMVIIDAETGERHPFWSELDSHPDAVEAGERLLILRPARNFEEGTRYIVALRNLKDGQGAEIEAGSAFKDLRDGSSSTIPQGDERRGHFNTNIFPQLEDAGIARDENLVLAWDFTVASERNLSERILHMRDTAFGSTGVAELDGVLGRLGDTDLGNGTVEGNAPKFVIDDSSEVRTDTWTDSRGNSHSEQLRVVHGRVTVPNFMDRIQQTEGHVKGNDLPFDFPAPGSRLLDANQDGLPEQNPSEPTVEVPFICDVPQGSGKTNVTLYGHGLLGTRDQYRDARKSPGRQGPFLGCAVDWWGMSTADAPTVVAILADASNIPSLPDRAQQGFLNFMFVGRAAIHPNGFATHAAFQKDGQSLVNVAQMEEPGMPAEPPPLYYDGNSQGGIMGGSLVAVSPDIQRGILGVTGMNYSTLLNRSVDWEGEFSPPSNPDELRELLEDGAEDPTDAIPPYSYPMYTSYADPIERQIVFSLMQMLWDRGETNGYAHHLTDDPLPNTPSHEVMLQVAWSDHQVANVSAEAEAATIGAPVMEGLEEHWAMDSIVPGTDKPQQGFVEEATYPHEGSALVYWDSGNPTPPNANIPPEAGNDPHGHPRDEQAAGWQEAHFLLTGQMYDVCDGRFYRTRRHPANGGQASCLEPTFAPGTTPPTDTDDDGISDDTDNCPLAANPGQEDSDGDGIGDVCEGDADGDGVSDDTDNCPDIANAGQEDADGDDRGDACDPPENTTLLFTQSSAESGQHSDTASFEVRLTDEQGDPIADAPVDFTFTGPAGERTSSGTTNDQGVATTIVELTDNAGAAQMKAFYPGADKVFEPDSTVAGFVVEHEITNLTLRVSGSGGKRALTATLLDDDGAPVTGRVLAFSADGNAICENSQPTNSSGVTMCDPPSKYQAGKTRYRATFQGDGYFTGSASS